MERLSSDKFGCGGKSESTRGMALVGSKNGGGMTSMSRYWAAPTKGLGPRPKDFGAWSSRPGVPRVQGGTPLSQIDGFSFRK